MELSHQRMHARDCEECEENDDTMLDVIRRHIQLKGDLDSEQSSRLGDIARRCPVHRTLEGGPKIIDQVEMVD